MNPYAAFFGNRDPLTVIAETPPRLQALLAGLTPVQIDRAPAPGKWSVRQILAHMADTEIVFAFRLRQAIAEENHVIQPFDQDAWAEGYQGVDAAAAVAVFSTLRRWNLSFIKALPAEAFTKTLSHPERGPMTFQVVVETMAGHDLNHLGQLEAVAIS